MSSEPTPTTEVAANVNQLEIADEMEQSYIDYAMSVIAGRALPDVRDGLKPVQRRILYAMEENGISSGAGHRKSSSIVGETMGNYHPHGDSAIYETLVRMAQDFSMRMPLVDGQGNFGSIDGDPAAAMRYTEARLTPLSETLLEDLGSDTVDWDSSYDDRNQEPSILPSRFPNLLVNGSSGIAVGMSTSIPPHNLGEIINATTHLIDNPDATVADLAEHVVAPDFPTGGTIVGHESVRKAYETGRAKLRVRSKFTVERNDSGRDHIIITEIPYQQNKSKLIERIADDVNGGDLEGIADLTDESDRNGVRIVLELKTRANTALIKNRLLDSHLEKTVSVINLALVDGQPKVLSLKGMLEEYLDHRKEVVRRRTQHHLEEAEEEAHILEGRLTALDHVDDVVETIREAEDRDGAKTALRGAFDLSDRQADHIVRMQLGSLTALEMADVETDYEGVQERIERLQEILNSESELFAVIKSELAEIRKEYAEDRRTNVIAGEGSVTQTDLIPDDDMLVFLTDEGYIKRVDADVFSSQGRDGKGVIGMNTDGAGPITQVIATSMHEMAYLLTDDGKIHETPVHRIEEFGRTARGTAIQSAYQLDSDTNPVKLFTAENFDSGDSLVLLSANGVVKRTAATEYESIHTGGIIGTKVRDGDRIVDGAFVPAKADLMVASDAGKTIRFALSDVRETGRASIGVTGLNLEVGDTAVGFAVVAPDGNDDPKEDASERDLPTQLLTITENGYGKRSAVDEYRQQSRGGKGVTDIDTGSRNGRTAQVIAVSDDTELVFATREGQVLRTPADGISAIGRASKGVGVVSLDEGDSVTTVTPLESGTSD